MLKKNIVNVSLIILKLSNYIRSFLGVDFKVLQMKFVKITSRQEFIQFDDKKLRAKKINQTRI